MTRLLSLLAVACAVGVAAPAYAGTVPLFWTWPDTSMDGSPLTDLNHGRMVLYRCRQDSIIRRQPPLKPTFLARNDSLVLPDIPAIGREGKPDSMSVDLADGRSYVVKLQAVDHFGWASPILELSVAVPATDFQPGLVGSYYVGETFTSWFGERIDPNVDVNWGTGPAFPGLASEHFSVRLTGMLSVPTSGPVTYRAIVNDACRLVIGGATVFNDLLTGDGEHELSGTVTLVQGRQPFAFEMFERTGSARATLYWTYPGALDQVVPASAFSH